MEDNMNASAFDQLAENSRIQAEANQKLTLVTSRAEALGIVVRIVNALISGLEKDGKVLSKEAIAGIQEAINAEDTETQKILAELEALMR